MIHCEILNVICIGRGVGVVIEIIWIYKVRYLGVFITLKNFSLPKSEMFTKSVGWIIKGVFSSIQVAGWRRSER